MIHINRSSDRPIYKQIYDGICQQIINGELKPGDVILSEHKFCEQYKISRMTLRAAIDLLVRDGFLIRQPGRDTTVSMARITRNALGFMSFTENMRELGMEVSSRVLVFHKQLADDTVTRQLCLPEKSHVIYLERLRLANNEPMALEKLYLPYDGFEGLLTKDLTCQSLYKLLEEEFNCCPILAEESIEAINLNTKEARLLGMPGGSAALLARRITRDERGTVVESVQTIYRADRYRMYFVRRRQE